MDRATDRVSSVSSPWPDLGHRSLVEGPLRPHWGKFPVTFLRTSGKDGSVFGKEITGWDYGLHFVIVLTYRKCNLTLNRCSRRRKLEWFDSLLSSLLRMLHMLHSLHIHPTSSTSLPSRSSDAHIYLARATLNLREPVVYVGSSSLDSEPERYHPVQNHNRRNRRPLLSRRMSEELFTNTWRDISSEHPAEQYGIRT